ncbi:MAG: proteobacterial dedicated sortase system histidine kinase [Pseudomonadota bacterium]
MMKFDSLRPGLRSKLLLLSSLLLLLPWFGYHYIQEMETTLQRGQEQMVANTAQALALTLNDRPRLFNSANAVSAAARNRLYVYPLPFEPSVTDGSLNDWRDFRQYEQALHEGSSTPYADNAYTSFRGRNRGGDPLELRLLVGEVDDNLYLYVRAVDRDVITPESERLQLEGADALILSTVSRDGVASRYRLSPRRGGEVQAWHEGDDSRDLRGYNVEARISGRYTETPEGYDYELKLPLALAERWLALAVEDVDDIGTRALAAIVASGDMEADAAQLQRPASELEQLLAAHSIANFRVRVFDRGQRLLYESGDIVNATGLLLDSTTAEDSEGAMYWLRTRLLHPLYDGLLNWIDERSRELQLLSTAEESPQLLAALGGAAQTGYRSDSDTTRRTLEAAWPISANGAVLGAVVVDQNLDGLRSARNQSLASLFDAMLAIMVLTLTVLLVFAGNLSARIRVLRDAAEHSIDEQGRLNKAFVASRSSDEIGDLSRSIANMMERLGHYNQYLENLTARLSHELRTPVTVVRSSLENLRMLAHSDDEAELYIQRAEEGISRLNLILTNMSEATRLEQILQGTEKEPTALEQVIAACVDQYRQIYPSSRFEAELARKPVMIAGSAEHLVQLMDKVVANAVEFSKPDHPIRISCREDSGEAVLTVSNSGPFLDPAMKDRIFDSMVSVRPEGRKSLPHLGLGLHIARLITEFHGGYIYAENLIGEEGVIVVVRLPLL